jgi:VWFA-related protein
MRILRTFLAGLLAASLIFPQEPEHTFRTTVDVVVAPTLVLDSDGNYVNGLQAEDFILLDNGKPQSIKVDVSFIPISLVVAIQANSNMAGVLPAIQKIGSLFRGLVVGEQGEVAIVAFDHRIDVKQDFTSDTDKLQAALQKITAGSSSSRMVDAVFESVRMLGRRPENRRRILMLISETRDFGSQARKREALEAAQFANVTVYSVNVNRFISTLTGRPQPPRPNPIPPTAVPKPAGVPHTPSAAAQMGGNATNSANFIPLAVEIFKSVKDVIVDNPVEVFTKWTGGEEHSFIRQKDLERAVQKIGETLHAQYIISYSPNNKDEGGFHEIEVRIRNRSLKTHTRPGYWIAARPQ